MLCYKNGALAREEVRDRYSNGDWRTFNEMVEQTPPGCNGYMGLYFPLPEIIPPNVVGEYFFATSHTPPRPVESIPESMHPRTILESQFLSIRSRVNQLLAEGSPDLHRLILTGGGSSNQVIRQLAAVSLFVPLLYLIQYLSRTYSMWTYMFPQRSKQQATGARYWPDMLGGNNHIPIGQLGI